MKAAVLEGVKNLVVKEIPTPLATNDMALVKVKAKVAPPATVIA